MSSRSSANERKAVTGLFTDVKGSTELEHDLDPQKTRSIIGSALSKFVSREAKLARMNYALEFPRREYGQIVAAVATFARLDLAAFSAVTVLFLVSLAILYRLACLGMFSRC